MLVNNQLRRFIKDERGNVIITFCLALMVTLLFIGGAIDLGRAYSLRSELQTALDATALNSVLDTPEQAATQLSTEQSLMLQRAQQLGATSITLNGQWRNSTDYEVTVTAQVPTAFLKAVPGMPVNLTVAARTVARGYKIKVVAGPPSRVDLSYEAADYNQVWAYCYEPAWQTKGTRASDEGSSFTNLGGNLAFVTPLAARENRFGRSDFVLIADNGGSNIPLTMPSCKEGERVSYMLYNQRNQRTTPSNWGRSYTNCGTQLSHTGRHCYTWFTDAKPDQNGVERHSGTSPYQLETVLCDDAACKQPRDGATIPGNNQRNRIPQVANACQPGKFMYFGWEDRPPQNQGGNGNGLPFPVGTGDPGGDRDYDDIRLVMSCPQNQRDERQVRLLE